MAWLVARTEHNGQEWWGLVSQPFSGRRRSAENETPGRGLARPGGDFVV